MLLVAIGCGRLPGMLDIVKEHSFVVFGTMDGNSIASFDNDNKDRKLSLPVYFYETG